VLLFRLLITSLNLDTEQADDLRKEATYRQKKLRAATLSRLHGHMAEKMEKNKKQLERCFSMRSRWGGLSFKWD